MIDVKYQNIISQCDKRINELNSWEQGFILGDPNDPRRPPLKEKSYLSTAQKNKLDQIAVTRLQGGKWSEKKVQIEFGDVSAEQTDEGWVVQVGGYPIGTGMVRKEVPIVTAWLNQALPALLQIPSKALKNYLSGNIKTQNKQQTVETEIEEEQDPF